MMMCVCYGAWLGAGLVYIICICGDVCGYGAWLGDGLVYIDCICVYGSWFGGVLGVWLEGMVMGRG